MPGKRGSSRRGGAVSSTADLDSSLMSDENSPVISRAAALAGRKERTYEDTLAKPFDSSRARSSLQELLDTGGVQEELKHLLSEFESVSMEHSRLRTSGAEKALSDFRSSVAEERARERAAFDAMQKELERTRAALTTTRSELQSLRDDPPPPSNDAVRESELFRRAATELVELRRAVASLEERATVAERERDGLERVVERRGDGGDGGGGEESGGGSIVELFEAMTGLSAEEIGPERFRVSFEYDGEEAAFILQYPINEDIGASADETVAMIPDRNPHLLPKCLQDPRGLECAPGDVPLFVRDLIDHLTGGLNEEGGEGE